MGDRASISFKTGDDESVAFFDHWGGEELFEEAEKYAKDLMATHNGSVEPIDRFEPNTVMVDWISHYLKGERITSRYYLGVDKNDGDNSDNGHLTIVFNVKKRKVEVLE